MRAIITGIRGQDGSLLRAHLVARGVQVWGVDRPRPGATTDDPSIRRTDLCDPRAVRELFDEVAPDEVYHLAACHHSSEQSGTLALDREMIATNFRAAETLIDTIAQRRPACRILLAGTSQMYAAPAGGRVAIDEHSPMNPGTFYGWTKRWSRELLAWYREHHDVYGSTTILFNHESPQRSPRFVTRKITMAAARASLGLPADLHLLAVGVETDWSAAADIVEGMRLALAADAPADYVLASGVTHTVDDVLAAAFGSVHLDWREHTTFDPPRGTPRGTLLGVVGRARTTLGWTPRVPFAAMIAGMVSHDRALLATQGGR